LFGPGLLACNKFSKCLLLLLLGLFLHVFKSIDSAVVHFFISLANLLFLLHKFTFFIFRKQVKYSWSPLHVVNCFLKSILRYTLANKTPDLVTLLSTEQDESTRSLHLEEVHAIDDDVLSSELEVIRAFAFLFPIAGDQSKRELPLFR